MEEVKVPPHTAFIESQTISNLLKRIPKAPLIAVSVDTTIGKLWEILTAENLSSVPVYQELKEGAKLYVAIVSV